MASSSKKVIIAALIGNALIAVTKFVAAAVTGSSAMLGLLVALFGIMLVQLTGIPYFDGIASILIGVILGATAIWLAYETKGLLIGESANQPVVKGIRGIVRESPHIHHVNEILTMHMGPEFVLVNVSADFMDAANASEIEASIAAMDQRIKARFPNVKRVFVEAESRKATRIEGGAAAMRED